MHIFCKKYSGFIQFVLITTSFTNAIFVPGLVGAILGITLAITTITFCVYLLTKERNNEIKQNKEIS